MPRRSQQRLSVGASAARKVMASGCGAPSFFVAGMLLWIIVQLMYETLTEQPINVWGALLPHLVVVAVFLLGAYVTVAVGSIMLGMIRYGGFLDGTMLAVRFVFRKRWVDLATADIDASYDPARGGVQLLVARSRDGLEVKLPVTQGPEAIPAHELGALADAITSRRVRTGPDDRAFRVAEQLRELATDAAIRLPGVEATTAGRPRPSPAEGPPRPAATPDGSEVDDDPHRGRDTAIVLALVFVPLLGAIVAIGFVLGRGTPAVVIAVLLGLAVVHHYRRALLKYRRERAGRPVG